MDRIIPTMDGAQSKEMLKVFKKQKMKFALSHGVTAVERDGDEVIVKATDKKGQDVEFKGDYVLVAVGRRAYTDGLNLEAVGVATDGSCHRR